MQIEAKTPEAAKEVKESVSGTQLWLVVMKAYHALQAYSSQTRADSGLGDSDFRVLEALLHKGALSVNVIGPKVFLTPGSISVAVDRLHKQGLVTRTEDKKDRRVRTVDLTPKGRTLIKRIFAAHEAEMNKLAEVLTGKERRQVARGLRTLGKEAAKLTIRA